jgi:O-antigen/teichoic acid export membrane protein
MALDEPALDGEASPESPQARGSFVGHVNIVLLTYAVDGALALATGALIARAIGPEGRGAYGLFVISAAFGQLVLGLGIGNAAIYYLNKREISLRDALGAMHFIVLAALPVTALVVAVVAPLDIEWIVFGETLRISGETIFGPVSPWLLVLAVPVLLYMNLLRLTLQALSRFVDLGIATVGQQAALLALVAVAFASGDATAEQIVVFLIVASAVAAAYAVVRIGITNIDPRAIVPPRMHVLRPLVRFGVQGEAGNVLQLMNYRLDQYIVRGFVGLGGVGVYAVAASMTEGIFILANAVALVLLPRMASASAEDAAWMAPVATRNTLLIAAAAAIALAIVAPVLLPLVFGDRFDDSVAALWWLLPGTVALAGAKVLTSYIFSQGRPLLNTMITCVSLAVTLIAGFALIPAYGVNGAAASSSLAYAVHLVAALYAYQRLSGQPALSAIVPRPSDVALYTDALHGLLRRGGARQLQAER